MKEVLLGQEIYKRISINDLILFGIYSINNKKCEFEMLVDKCFTLFPKVFALSHYPKWPDSRKLDRSLRALRSKKFIAGNPKTFFYLTKKGRKKALEITNVFRQKKLL